MSLDKCPKCGMLMCACDVDHIPSCGCNGCEIARLRGQIKYRDEVIEQRNAMLRRVESDLAASEASLAALQARWDARPVAEFTDVYGNSLRVSDSCTDCGCARGQHEHGTGLCGVAGCACDGYVLYEGRT